jgi:CHAT domain-containing protein
LRRVVAIFDRLLRSIPSRRPIFRGLRVHSLVWICLLLPLLTLQDTQQGRIQRAYSHALALYHRGQLLRAQQEAEEGFRVFREADADWTARFLILDAEVALWRGFFRDALQTLAQAHPPASDPGETVHALTVEAQARAYQGDLTVAVQRLDVAERICTGRLYPQCGSLFKTEGSVALLRGEGIRAWELTQKAYAFAIQTGDRYLKRRAALNLGWIAGHQGRYGEAEDWDRRAWREAEDSDDLDTQLIALGNMGADSLFSVDPDAARLSLEQAVKNAEILGNIRTEIQLLALLAHCDFSQWRLREAEADYRNTLDKASALNDRPRLVESLTNLAGVLMWQGRAEEAEKVLVQYRPLEASSDQFSQKMVVILQARVRGMEGHEGEAEAALRPLLEREMNPRLYTEAAMVLGTMLAREKRFADAETVYRSAIERFEAEFARSGSFAAQVHLKYSASLLFSGAIHLLAQEGKAEAALQLADRFFSSSYEDRAGSSQSKARQATSSAFDPRAVARRSGATILTYWLGHDASYLWIVTPQTVKIVVLPSELELAPKIRAYRQAVVEMRTNDPAVAALGRELYATLVAPAASDISRQGQVILIDDEALSKLNFETLLAPNSVSSPAPGQPASTGSHYWIEDVTLRTASSLTALRKAQDAVRAAASRGGKLLLMGDAQQASPDYPPLLEAPLEMEMVRKRFAPATATVLAQQAATPMAYAHSNPGQYAYIHFVTHGVPSPADPLDSLIVLSRSSDDEDSFKLYAREILAHPLHARLVTISACYGSGSRYFVGQGMVGLGWAFQRAGAENVIGALWEISDYSTPQLMDKLYMGVQRGLLPADALRQAKLSLLHGAEKFQAPFFWAPFQVYAAR